MSSTQTKISTTKALSIVEGSACNVMVGFGEQYVVPFALRIGASSSQVALISSIPAFIGSLFQLLSARLVDKHNKRKRIVTTFVLFQAFSLLPLFLLPFFTKSFYLLVFCFILYHIFGNLTNPAWSSWIGDLIPKHDRARYFSLRNKVSLFFLFLSVILSGMLLNYFTSHIYVGFGLLFLIAFLGRLFSFFLFLNHYEPKYESDIWKDSSFKKFISDIPSSIFGRFVIFRSFLSFAVMISSPFYAVLMLKVFMFDYVQFSILILAPMLAKTLSMTYWGKLSHTMGNKNVLKVSSLIISSTPLSWFISSILLHSTVLFYVLLVIELISGFAWSGLELATFNYILDSSSSKKRVNIFAYFNVVFNLLVMLGGLFGSLLIILFSKNSTIFISILIILLISSITRFLVSILLTPKVSEIGNHEIMENTDLFHEVLVRRPLLFASKKTYYGLSMVEKYIYNFLKNHTTRKPLSKIEIDYYNRKSKKK